MRWIAMTAMAAVFSAILGAAAEAADIEADVLQHHAFRDRYIDTVNVHVWEKASQKGIWEVDRGLTVTRATGYVNFQGGRHMDSNAVGIGPAIRLKGEKRFAPKWSAAMEGSGAFLMYNRAFPAGGRAYNFMWRIGPSLAYHPNKDTAVSAGWTFMHVSNGLKTRNPGYNGAGLTAGITFSF